jgi:hypothetical protein
VFRSHWSNQSSADMQPNSHFLKGLPTAPEINNDEQFLD